MKAQNDSLDKLLRNLQEREKELNCLYNVEEILNTTAEIEEALRTIIEVIPPGWQYSDCCQTKIMYNEYEYHSPNFQPTQWVQSATIEVEETTEGEISIYYTEEMPQEFEGPFLKEERKLLDNIADRIGKYIFHIRGKKLMKEWETAKTELSQKSKSEWQVIVDLLRRTDHELLLFVSRKMTYYLCSNGIKEAQELLQNFGTNQKLNYAESTEDVNKPSPKISLDMLNLASQTFEIAAAYLNDDDILAHVQRWIQENRTNFLVKSLDSTESTLGEMIDAIRHFHHMMLNSNELPVSTQKIVNVSLVLKFFTDHLDFIKVARDYIDANEMYELLKRIIFSERGRGKLGGKSAGLFLASRIIKKASSEDEALQNIKVPKTWYITSDVSPKFTFFNNLEEIKEQKYKPIELVRLEYPHITQIFKNSPFPPEILNGLSVALDDLGDHPLIVRSSSLLEDRLRTAFSGKYKSLFLANQGTKKERLAALTDAIAEVYASTFGPDPIEYRAEKGLLEFNEAMGIMIQQVVGTRVGKYFLPSYAGVAFSYNEFRL